MKRLYPDIPRGFLLRRRDRYHFDPDQQIAAQPDYGTGCFHSRIDAGVQGYYSGTGRRRNDLRRRHAAHRRLDRNAAEQHKRHRYRHIPGCREAFRTSTTRS